MALENPNDVLAEFRWTADRIVMSPTWGERYWLKQIEGGITDCCPANDPCEYHAKLTHSASSTKQ